MTAFVIVFIIGSGTDKAMMVMNNGYGNADHDWLLDQAAKAGIKKPEVVGQVEIPTHIADEMGDGRIYVG